MHAGRQAPGTAGCTQARHANTPGQARIQKGRLVQLRYCSPCSLYRHTGVKTDSHTLDDAGPVHGLMKKSLIWYMLT